jgi:hypothetical protein
LPPVGCSYCIKLMKVIFLDVDGVLHPLTPHGRPVGCDMSELCARADSESSNSEQADYVFPACTGEFRPDCVQLLGSIVHETGACIVLSSTWRETRWATAAVNSVLRLAGLGETIGATKVLSYDPANPTNRRGREIMDWVTAHDVSAFVVLDDCEFSLGTGALDAAHMVKTDEALGLTAADATRAIGLLGAKCGSLSGQGIDIPHAV